VGRSSAIGLMQAWIYSETAAMFRTSRRDLAVRARGAGTFLAPRSIGAFGYWIGWSVVLSIFGKVIGDLVISKCSRRRHGTSPMGSQGGVT